MMVSAEERTTAVVRRLRVGDKFRDSEGVWKVVDVPTVVEGKEVWINLQAMGPSGKRAVPGSHPRIFSFGMDDRVEIVR